MLDLVDNTIKLGKMQFPHQNEMIWEKQASTLVNFEILNELLYVLSTKCTKIVNDSQN